MQVSLYIPIYMYIFIQQYKVMYGIKWSTLRYLGLWNLAMECIKSVIIVKLCVVEYKITTFIYKFLIFVFWIDNRRCRKGILIWSCHIACRSSEIKPPENRCLLNSIHLLEKSSNYEELYRENISFKIIRYFLVSHGNEIIQDKL